MRHALTLLAAGLLAAPVLAQDLGDSGSFGESGDSEEGTGTPDPGDTASADTGSVAEGADAGGGSTGGGGIAAGVDDIADPDEPGGDAGIAAGIDAGAPGGGGAGPAPDSATVSAADPDGLLAALRSMGHEVRRETDSAGAPLIQARVNGIAYSVWFYGCDGTVDCTGLNFSAGFDLVNGSDFREMNGWNRSKLVGRGFLNDELDPYIDHFVVTMDGIPMPVFERVVERWSLALNEFREHIDF